MASKCPRCSAECTCRKKRRKPRVGRAARSKPVAIPPIPQQFFFGAATPTAPPALKDIASVPYQVRYDTEFREPAREARRATEMEIQTTAPPMIREMGVTRATQAGPERTEMEVQAGPERAEMEIQTEPQTIRVGRQERLLDELRSMVESGEQSLVMRPTRYRERMRRVGSAGPSTGPSDSESAYEPGRPYMPGERELMQRVRAELRGPAPPPVGAGRVRFEEELMRRMEGGAAGGGAM